LCLTQGRGKIVWNHQERTKQMNSEEEKQAKGKTRKKNYRKSLILWMRALLDEENQLKISLTGI
jgi:hypothetical protein